MMKNNVYGILGIGVRNGLWNADFDGQSKRDGNGIIKGSSYALQYCIKRQWDRNHQNIMGLKTMKEDGTCLKIEEKYYKIFHETDKKPTKKKDDYSTILNNLLKCKDVLHFGVTYTGKPNVNIQGLLQFSEGINLYHDTHEDVEAIITPYANQVAKEDKKNATTGARMLLDEAHYIYDFSLFPKEYDKYISDDFKGYTKEDYEDFKNQSIIAVSNYNSKAKAGCKNEFAMFIETKEDTNYLLDLNCLNEYINIYKNNDSDNKIIYDLKIIAELLNALKEKIDKVEMFYNPRTVEIKGIKKNDRINIYDLITREKL